MENPKYLTEQHMLLNNPSFKEEIEMEIGKSFELSENENLTGQNLGGAANIVPRGKF